jgi:hypothetical protein
LLADLREAELRIVGVHTVDLVSGRGAKDLDYFDELIDPRFTWE